MRQPISITYNLEDMIRRLDALADARIREKLQPTEDQKKILLEYWPKKNHDEIARVLGVCTNTALRWYREAAK